MKCAAPSGLFCLVVSKMQLHCYRSVFMFSFGWLQWEFGPQTIQKWQTALQKKMGLHDKGTRYRDLVSVSSLLACLQLWIQIHLIRQRWAAAYKPSAPMLSTFLGSALCVCVCVCSAHEMVLTTRQSNLELLEHKNLKIKSLFRLGQMLIS